ncbi:MAG: GGDEF domain-containing protein [Actinobacteria bacterium]|nr:MAG: GGDEF domain-containing protein [Actinomycetota bacterium]
MPRSPRGRARHEARLSHREAGGVHARALCLPRRPGPGERLVARAGAEDGFDRRPHRRGQPARLRRHPGQGTRPGRAWRGTGQPGNARHRRLQGAQRPARPPDGRRRAAFHRRRGVRGVPDLRHGGYGGEEFAVILPGCTQAESLMLAERLREVVVLAGAEVRVTASVGVATYPVHASDAQELIQAADGALYVSKRSGRNRVSQAPGRPVSEEAAV